MANAEDKQPASQVVPLLVAALVCDVAVADPASGKKNLIGIFDRINVSGFPTSRPMALYFKFTDAEGHYEFDARYIRVDEEELLAGAKSKFTVEDRLQSHDLYIPFPRLDIPAPGRYEFQIWANKFFLGSTFIDAMQRPN